MVMDRTTLLDPDYPPKYKPYLERRIPKHFHLLVQHLTMRNPSKRPCAKVILKVCSKVFFNFLSFEYLAQFIESGEWCITA